MSDITRILTAIEAGDRQAASDLLPMVYDELRKLAASKLAKEQTNITLQATALVHEAYLKLVGNQQFEGRSHFFGAAAEAMRRILVDQARSRKSLKRGGALNRDEMAFDLIACPAPDDELLALDEALSKFSLSHPDHAELVKLRYFAGLSADEAAAALDISPSTADRRWNFARAWLKNAMG